MPEEPQSACLLGAGAVAHALAHDLTQAGWTVRAWARRPERAPAPRIDLAQLGAVDLVLICVTDGAIEEVAGLVHSAVGARITPAIVMHTSGYHDRTALAVLADDGWSTGGLHPLCAVPPLDQSDPSPTRTLAGSWFAGEGDALVQATCARIVTALSGQLFPLPTDPRAKARYHAAATLIAAGSVALLDAAMNMIGAADDASHVALRQRAFADLGRGALENAASGDTDAALTGPHARGDAAVVGGHLDLMRSIDGAPTDLYLEVSRRALELVRNRGAISQQLLERLEETLNKRPES